MQKFKTIQIGKTSITALELRVKDIRNFLSALDTDSRLTDENINSYISANSADMVYRAKHLIVSNKEIENFTKEEIEKTIELFMEVNKGYFQPEKTESSAKRLPLLVKKAIENIETNIINLIGNGHLNAMEYGWSFYNSVIEILNKQAENGK